MKGQIERASYCRQAFKKTFFKRFFNFTDSI